MSWPSVELDDIRRLRILAASIPGAQLAETVLEAPIERVWSVAGDLEGRLSSWAPDVRSVRPAGPRRGRPSVVIIGRSGLRGRFEVVLRPGWCLLQSRFVLGGMAAVADGERTRFAFVGALRGPARLASPLLRIGSGLLLGHTLRRFAVQVADRDYEQG